MALSFGEPEHCEVPVIWEQIEAWLQNHEYQAMVSWILETQGAAQQQGDQALLHLVTAVYQVCTTVQLYEAEVDIRKEAYETAVAQTFEVQQQLKKLLYLVCEQNTAVVSPQNTHEISSALPQSIWERLQTVIKRPESVPTAQPQQTARPQNGVPSHSENEFTSARLMVYCLGNFRVIYKGMPVENWSGNKSKSIFKYLMAHRNGPIHREQLMETFWPDDSPEAARRNLYQAIYMIRKALSQDSDEQTILCEDGRYLINPDLFVWMDSEAFLYHYQNGRQDEIEQQFHLAIKQFETADSLYQGAYLAEDIYEDWPVSYRENLKLAHLEILDKLSKHYWEAGNYPVCITYCRKILAEDNCREDAHRRLMMAHVRQGQRHLALRQYYRCVEALAQELEVEPMPATIELYHNLQNDPSQI